MEITNKHLEIVATSCSIIGALLNAFLRIEGFYVWCFGNVAWMYLGYRKKLWGLLLTFAIFTVLNILGIIVWAAKK
jgi:hypothetical protein